MQKTILIIEDETPIRNMLALALTQAKFNIIEAEDAKKAFDSILQQRPHLILLDWMLPGTSGVEVARLLKTDESTAKIPIIMLTARATEENKIQGFAAGIDDYIVKPFSPRELIARINAVLRRTEKEPLSRIISIDDLVIDPNTETITVEKEPIKLNPTEYRLLLFFSTAPEKVYSRSQLLTEVWSHSTEVDERAVDAAIKRLRQALGPKFGKLIRTVHGRGYCFSKESIESAYRFEKMRQDFVANVSHELRTPLTVFRGYLEMLLEETDVKKEWRNILTQMFSQSMRMERIIEDLLLLSSLEIETPDTRHLDTINMQELLEHIYQDTRALSGDKKQQIHLKITGPHTFQGKKSELQSAFSNLAFNAVHYTPVKGTIWISWYEDKNGVHFKVEDTGIGIEPRHIPRLTERFYRVDAGRTRETGGTGLGLAIVKHVLLRHHAHLFIKSVVNKGSVFRCDFPSDPVKE